VHLITTQASAKRIDNDPQFNLRVQYLLSKSVLRITVNELQNLYIETFHLDFSPLLHCNKTEKAIIISTVPTVIVLSRLDQNVFLGNVNTFVHGQICQNSLKSRTTCWTTFCWN